MLIKHNLSNQEFPLERSKIGSKAPRLTLTQEQLVYEDIALVRTFLEKPYSKPYETNMTSLSK